MLPRGGGVTGTATGARVLRAVGTGAVCLKAVPGGEAAVYDEENFLQDRAVPRKKYPSRGKYIRSKGGYN